MWESGSLCPSSWNCCGDIGYFLCIEKEIKRNNRHFILASSLTSVVHRVLWRKGISFDKPAVMSLIKTPAKTEVICSFRKGAGAGLGFTNISGLPRTLGEGCSQRLVSRRTGQPMVPLSFVGWKFNLCDDGFGLRSSSLKSLWFCGTTTEKRFH